MMEYLEANKQRNWVIWFGPEPQENVKLQYVQRELELKVCTIDDLDENINLSRAIVIPYAPETSSLVRELIQERRVLQYGVSIHIITSSDTDEIALKRLANIKDKYHDRIKIYSAEHHAVAQWISHYNPGPYAKHGLTIYGETNPNICLLLKRAFWDCGQINLILLDGGSTSIVYRAEVFLGNALASSPLPILIKYDLLEKIRSERRSYDKFATGYLPFNHRPNLIPERYIEGQDHGLIVSNFVEHSETLAAAALRGTFTPAIYSLFHQAMRGWRSEAFCEPHIQHTITQSLSLIESLEFNLPTSEKLFRRNQLEMRVLAETERLGCKSSVAELIQKVKKMPRLLHVRGFIHGDLRAENIHVRGTDAILIDFERTNYGPLIWDQATLEVSLMFGDLYNKLDPIKYEKDWFHVVDQFYKDEHIQSPLSKVEVPQWMEGICSCIREIRLNVKGLEIETNTYRQSLAILLLIRSLRKLEESTTDWEVRRRAHAFLLSERLLQP